MMLNLLHIAAALVLAVALSGPLVGAAGGDPTYPAGNVTLRLTIESAATCAARPVLKHFPVNVWANGVVGFDDPLALYGLNDLSKDIMDPTKLKSWGTVLKEGTYNVAGGEPILYACAFSPSLGYAPPAGYVWRMCGCCFQLNADNATNFIGDCQDTEGTCEDYCTVKASGGRSNRVYDIHLGKP